MFSLLQSARFFAALLVVFRHGAVLFEDPRYFDHRFAGGLFRSGDAGVDFFFVLSGFIILHAHAGDIGRPARVWPYILRRVIRIYPAYLVLLPILAAGALLTHTQYSDLVRQPLYLLQNALLLPSDNNLLAVAWTLNHEIVFYALFALLIFDVRLGAAALAAWAIAAGFIQGPLLAPEPLLSSPHHIEFLLGMAAASMLRQGRLPAPGLMLAIGLAGFAATCAGSGLVWTDVMETTGPNLVLPLGLSSMLIVMGLVEVERSGAARAPSLLRLLGDASYSIYLVHFPALTLAVQLGHRFGLQRHAGLPVLFAAMVIGATAAGLAYYLVIERPLLGLLKRWLLRPRKPAAIAPEPSLASGD